MKALCISILVLLASMATCQNMTGMFLSDWQNTAGGQCAPDFFTITETSNNTYIATYNYTDLSVSQHCSFTANFTGNYSASLSQVANGTWVDTEGQQLIYDETHDVFYFVFKTETEGSPYLYDRNGSYFPVEVTMDNIGGSWINPTPLNTSANETCCVPDSFYITIANQNFVEGEIHVFPNYSTTTCSRHVTGLSLTSVFTPSINNIIWTGYGATMNVMSDYFFNPYNATQLTVHLVDTNNTCWYTYDKVPNHNLISGTWHLDWQAANALFVPENYSISIVNGSFMEGTLQYSYSSDNSTSYVVGNGQNEYSDSTMQLDFQYDKSTNTLLTVPNSDTAVLFSPTGSLIPNNLADTYWNNSQDVDSNGSLGPCCVPDFISITSTSVNASVPNVMNVAYTLPSDYASNLACGTIVPFVTSQNELDSVLNITVPNITLVTWTDESFSTQISFTNTSTTSEIVVFDFAGGSCTFKMTATTAPPTPPGPLSGSWISIEVKAIMVLCMFVLFGSM